MSPPNRSLGVTELSEMLGQSLGDDKALELVSAHARQCRAGEGPYSLEEALAILESIARCDGIVGTTARFAKSRLHLMTLR